MYKLVARVVSVILLTSSVFFIGSEVAAKTPITNITEAGDQGPIDNGQRTNKSATDLAFVKYSSGLRNFMKEVYTGQGDTITGLFVNEGFALNVLQQPTGSPGYISPLDDTVTEFGMARDYGTIGMLAHNYLAGDDFFQLEPSEVIYLVFGDSSVQPYTIVNILSYQALQPTSPYSTFLNTDNPDEYLSAADLFYKIYGQEDALVLQTCIENQGVESWGRLFIIAIPGAIPQNSGVS